MRSALKNYLIKANIIVGIVIISIVYLLLPTLKKMSPDQAGVMKNATIVGALIFIFLFNISFGIFIFLFNIFFGNLNKKFGKEERETRAFLKINPVDPWRQEKLKKTIRKEIYLGIIQSIFIIIFALIFGFLVSTLIIPILLP